MSERLPPAFVEKYKIGRVIGEECVRKSDGSKFAVKCINKNALNPKDRSNLVQEINILKELFDVYGEDVEMCYLVMEHAVGGELFDRIIAKEYYTEAEAKKVVKVVAKVLAYCHSEGVTHRDLKPENLLYSDETEDAKIKIADFGFAKLVTAETNMSTMCGTPGYYAPEIVRKQPVRERRVVSSRNSFAIRILHGDFEFVEPYFDGVSAQAKDLIRKMLVVDPEKRMSAKFVCCQTVLTHPWFNDCKDDDDHILISVGKKLKEAKLSTTRSKFRAGVGVVIAVNKTQRLLNMKIGRASI
ncbi:Camk/camk1 protein kinase, partial [Globisporangium splendens]